MSSSLLPRLAFTFLTSPLPAFPAFPAFFGILLLEREIQGSLEKLRHVSYRIVNAEDLAWALTPALRHRLLPSFEAEARGLTGDALVADVLHDVPDLPSEVERVLAAVDR